MYRCECAHSAVLGQRRFISSCPSVRRMRYREAIVPIFRLAGDKATKLTTLALGKERELQRLVEANLLEMLDMHLLASEYVTTAKGRIDTLAVDTSGAPVIIEYKKSQNENIINQGLSYLRWLKAQKSEFFQMLIQQKLPAAVAKDMKVDWPNPRVVCIAESYNKFDLDTVEVLPLRLELFRYRMYETGILSLEPVTVSEQESTPAPSRSQVRDEPLLAPPSVEDFAKLTSPELREAFFQLRDLIMALDENVTERCTTYYLAYRASKNFAELIFRRESITFHMRSIDYVDPQRLVSKIPDSYGWTLSRRVVMTKPAQLEAIFDLIQQSYKDVL